ncbi:hydroxysqualene dehydroxylase HpnE [Inhella sp.]|uniref:hydroxysqualene dehydroxylase HpnE n=1 Tax=Inhella sp. TaxID=1921806 RepID=UPI0035B47100
MKLLVIGGGWAGLAAAVRAVQRGAEVTLWEMAAQAGGRARSWQAEGRWLDSGQHILIGAYRDTLKLMREVGAEPELLLQRLPLTLVDAQGQGLRWGRGGPLGAAFGAVQGHTGWGWRERLGLVVWGSRLALRGLRCPAHWSVERLCQGLPNAVREELVEPLCVAALNTRIEEASATVFLRVLRDALFSGPGGSDLLLPRVPLQALLPDPALVWLRAHGASVQLGRRAQQLQALNEGWACDDWQGDAIVLACSAHEAQRLAAHGAPQWARWPLRHEAIATVELELPGGPRLPAPMVALRGAPAQFLFDIPGDGRYVAVASAVAAELADGLQPLAERMEQQVKAQLPALRAARRVNQHADRRATFACVAGVARPPQMLRPGLVAAGDYVEGPYPATLEGAVSSGVAAAAHLLGTIRST